MIRFTQLGNAVKSIAVPDVDATEVLLVITLDAIELSIAPEIDGDVSRTFAPEPVEVVTPVPPLATGKAVPDRPIANVPLVVTGEPEIDKNDGTVAATLVTVPPAVPFDTAVTNPLALTVTLAFVNEPTLALTVASVPVAVTFAEPLKLGLVYAKSPVISIVLPVVRVAAEPVVL